MKYARLKNLLKLHEGTVNTVLSIMSIFALGLIISAEVVPESWTLPFLDISWQALQIILRAIIWTAFTLSFVFYVLGSGRPLSKLRRHIPDLIVILAWAPHIVASALGHSTPFLDVTRLLPGDILQLLGTLAHLWKGARWGTERFAVHPLVVVGSSCLLVAITGAALMNHIEPQTFHSFWDGAWFSLVTMAHVGYGDLVPHTAAGRAIASILILAGGTLLGGFFVLIYPVAQRVLSRGTPLENLTELDKKDQILDILKDLQERDAQREAQLAELVDALKAANATVEELKKKQDVQPSANGLKADEGNPS